MIVQELHEIQHRCGYLPKEELKALSNRISVPLNRIHQVASHFPHYRLEPPPDVDVKVCRDLSCHMHGACQLTDRLRAAGREFGAGRVSVSGVSCLGQCDRPPVVSINESVYWGKSETELRRLIAEAIGEESLSYQSADRSAVGWQIDPYDGEPAYKAIENFVKTQDVDQVLDTLETGGLVGMGGAAFPTHLKWKFTRKAPGDVKYVVCNGDESEPGTFKDRELLLRTPYLVIEGMALAGFVIGAQKGYVYIRHEFEQQIEATRAAIEEAKQRGFLGEKILGSNLNFDLEVFVSPGGYICGEESALLEAMEDRRAEPRNKPPFTATAGLYSKPTVLNNVETLAWVPSILVKGGEWYRDQGVNGAKGLRFFSISGDVKKPGVYEVPSGLTLRELVFQHAGGLADGVELKAVAPSGPSGGYLPSRISVDNVPGEFADQYFKGAKSIEVLDVPLNPDTYRAMNAMLGAAIVVIGERTCMVDMALNAVSFYRNESCGKCVPCRMGSQKLVEIIEDMVRGRFPNERLAMVEELAGTMVSASICGLGAVASNPITTVMTHFAEELNTHIQSGRCPAGVCDGR